ncbi:MAG: isoleucine--tRNA ligase [Patescibacteria group bacterium]
MPFLEIDNQKKLPELEQEVLEFWRQDKTFEKSLDIRKKAELYSFYDGPPFATGTMHYGHIVGSVMKDIVPRYWTMRGFLVPRVWGWDCHGLPIENIAEKELGVKRKKEIEAMGVDKFNQTCRSKVMEYVKEWEKDVERLGRWADMENAYRTMDPEFMETIWWVFKQLYDQGLIYEGYRSMHICPRCETTLSQSEVAEGYQEVKDLSVTAKFKLKDEDNTYVLAWTTTPWTLLGNVALAVGADIDYVKIRLKDSDENLILAKDRVADMVTAEYEELDQMKGKDLVGKAYEPLFDDYAKLDMANKENGWKIYAAGFVTTEDGTGVVHIAPAFGEDDMILGQENNLPFVQHVGMDGVIKDEVAKFAGQDVKPKEDPTATDVMIMKDLQERGVLFKKEKYAHSYPHCWRCDTPLLNYATSSWFVAVTKLKEKLLANAAPINWIPQYIKEGRFGNWLEGARDWSISRQRYWASVIPIWRCECGELKVVGSIEELYQLSGEKVDDLHKDVVDKITFPCEKCKKTMGRIPDVLDCWFESGSMPYAQMHYPFDNEELFKAGFPAKYIGEGIDQTSKWFFYLHVIATALKDSRAFDNVIVNGIVLAEDGKKMSKRLQNYPDPRHIFEKYGADPLRFYLLSSPVVAAENFNFMEKDVAEAARGIFRMLWNTYSFFVMYANIDNFTPSDNWRSDNLLDRWIMSELNILTKEVNERLEAYELNKATRLFPKFVDNLSNWYVRRSRRRFWKSESDTDKQSAYQTLYVVLVQLTKLMAPFTPFMTETIFMNLTNKEKGSVHLQDYPLVNEKLIDEKLSADMAFVRQAVEMGLSARAKAGIKVRQPLNKMVIKSVAKIEDEQLFDLIKDEVNVKEIELVILEVMDNDADMDVELDINITDELKIEGMARDIVRHIQQARKEAGFNVDDRIVILYETQVEEIKQAFVAHAEYIAHEVLAERMVTEDDEEYEFTKEADVEKMPLVIKLKRV